MNLPYALSQTPSSSGDAKGSFLESLAITP